MTPGAILYAQKHLANLAAEIGKPVEALAEYQASLESAPARLNSYPGAMRAARGPGCD